MAKIGDDRSNEGGVGASPQRTFGGLRSSGTLGDQGAIGGAAERVASDGLYDAVVQVSFACLGLPPGWLVASQQVGDFTQSATAEVESAASGDFAASQTVGDFTQSAAATVQVDASASQTVGSFTQSATAAAQVDAQAAQTVGDFAQSAEAEADSLPADFAASQQVGDFSQVATAENDSPPATSEATPGYARTRGYRYRVRVGNKWVTVDPLDPLSVRAAMAQAEEAAERQAQGTVVDAPQTVAKRVVRVDAPRVSPKAAGVDYGALRADAERIAEQVRAVYAEALQRELIARLMREAMDRDEDEAVLLLLG